MPQKGTCGTNLGNDVVNEELHGEGAVDGHVHRGPLDIVPHELQLW